MDVPVSVADSHSWRCRALRPKARHQGSAHPEGPDNQQPGERDDLRPSPTPEGPSRGRLAPRRRVPSGMQQRLPWPQRPPSRHDGENGRPTVHVRRLSRGRARSSSSTSTPKRASPKYEKAALRWLERLTPAPPSRSLELSTRLRLHWHADTRRGAARAIRLAGRRQVDRARRGAMPRDAAGSASRSDARGRGW